MPQSKILLDTNAYLRLAQTIHPLLFVTFGKNDYTLYVIKEFQREFNRAKRLTRNFPWVNLKEFKENRSKSISLSKEDKKNIEIAWSYIWNHNMNQGFGASEVDVRALSVGFVLSIPVVTDDKDMIDLARSLGIEVMRILDLLAIMVESDHITHDKIKELVAYLHYHNDLPYKNFIRDINEKFGLDTI